MFEQTFKNIDDVLWKEAGCATELDYTEQTSWMLFLKYLDDLERANEQKAELAGRRYQPTIDVKHRWSVWAAPKKKDGSFDHDKALTGDDLIKYVDDKLFPYLKGFRTRAEGANTIEYKIGEIFSEIENKFRSGYSLRDALELIDQLSFRSQQDTRSERVETRKSKIFDRYDSKLQVFLDFVLAQYVNQGVGELDQDKLGDLLQLKYHTVMDAADQLGGIPAIRDTFIGFQRYLYD